MKNKSKIIIACNDAGGAEVISSFARKNKDSYVFVCALRGPAIKIFERKKLSKFIISGNNKPDFVLLKNKDTSMVLAGTSWASSLELDYIKAARKEGIKSAAYLDHWTNYRERFGYPRKNWKENLPDEIWVGDKYAYGLSKKFFKNMRVKLVPNMYFQDVKDECAKTKNKKISNILFLSEPLGSQINCFGDKKKIKKDEFYILSELLNFLLDNKIKNDIIIRLHPSEAKNKYNEICIKYQKKLNIKVSRGNSLVKDISSSKLVIGMESMALIISCICGKNTVSFLPGLKHDCELPFKEIKKIKKTKDLQIIKKFI